MKCKTKLLQAEVFCAAALGMGSSLSIAATFTDANWISLGGHVRGMISLTDSTP